MFVFTGAQLTEDREAVNMFFLLNFTYWLSYSCVVSYHCSQGLIRRMWLHLTFTRKSSEFYTHTIIVICTVGFFFLQSSGGCGRGSGDRRTARAYLHCDNVTSHLGCQARCRFSSRSWKTWEQQMNMYSRTQTVDNGEIGMKHNKKWDTNGKNMYISHTVCNSTPIKILRLK